MYIVQSTCISFSLFKISSLFENFEQQKNKKKENLPEDLTWDELLAIGLT